MKRYVLPWIGIVGLGLGLINGSAFAAAPIVLLSDKTPNPSSTIEVRFPGPVVASSAIGESPKSSPLTIRPKVPGTFRWLSRSSGRFTPSSPYALGTNYEVTVRELTDAQGQKTAPVQFEFTTPVIGIQSAWPSISKPEQSFGRDGTIFLIWNAGVDPEKLQKFVYFREINTSAKVPAKLTHRHHSQYLPDSASPTGSLLTWDEQFTPPDSWAEETPTAAGLNVIAATPATPLPEGIWELVADTQIASKKKGEASSAGFTTLAGTVTKFGVEKITADNTLESGRTITIQLNSGLPYNVTAADVESFVSVRPEVPELKIAPSYNQIVISGKFDLRKNYEVEVLPGLADRSSEVMEIAAAETCKFDPLSPRIYLPDTEGHQLNSGRREIAMLTVNLPKFQVRARVFSPEAVTDALTRYAARITEDAEGERMTHKVDFADLPGELVFEKDFEVSGAEDEPVKTTLAWQEVIASPEPRPVLLEVESTREGRRPGVQSILQLTDLGVVWKSGGHQVFACVFSMTTGDVVPGAQVALITPGNAIAQKSVTDKNGVAVFDSDTTYGWMVVSKDHDLHALPFDERRVEVSNWMFGVSARRPNVAELAREAYLFTDRDLYLPTDRVRIRGFAREWTTGNLALPEARGGKVTIHDPRGRECFSADVILDDQGAWELEMALESARPGEYFGRFLFTDQAAERAAEVNQEPEPVFYDDEASGSFVFVVKDFEPAAFDLKARMPERVAAGDNLVMPIVARYQMGTPLRDAVGAWSANVGSEDFWHSEYLDFRFGLDYQSRRQFEGSQEALLEGSVTFNNEGVATLTVVPPENPIPGPRSFDLNLEVTDPAQQTIGVASRTILDSSDYYLGLSRTPGFTRLGRPIEFFAIAVKPDGTPWESAVEATIKISKVAYRNVRVQTPGGATSVINETDKEVIREFQGSTAELSHSSLGYDVRSGTAPLSFIPAEAGLYQIEIQSVDPKGQTVLTAVHCEVGGPSEEADWEVENPLIVQLVPAEREYAPGDTAKILVKTPVEGTALICVERETIRRWFTTELKGESPIIEIPLDASDAPNVFVSLTLLRGSKESAREFPMPDYRIGYCTLNVNAAINRLTLGLEANPSVLGTKQSVEVIGKIVDANGQPVEGARVTLFGVDEAVMALTGQQEPDAFDYFYRQRPLAIRTGLTLQSLRPEDPGALEFHNKGYMVGGGGFDLGDIELRSDSPPCLFWRTDLVSDVSGTIRAVFETAEALTAYRIMGVVSDGVRRFGNASTQITVQKPFMLQSSVPAHANVGDRLQLRAVLFNETETQGSAAVQVLPGNDKVQVENPAKAALEMPALSTREVDFALDFKSMGDSTIAARAELIPAASTASSGVERLTDGILRPIQIGSPYPALREVVFTKNNPGNLLGDLDPQFHEVPTTFEIIASTSRLIDVRQPFEDLLNYPYGCLEQTISSLLPWTVVSTLSPWLPQMDEASRRSKDAVAQGLRRIESMRTESGGLSYWPGSESPMAWGTAYGLFGLAKAQQSGFEIPQEIIDSLSRWLSTHLRNLNEVQSPQLLEEAALSLLALREAGKPEPAYGSILLGKRDLLSDNAKIYLALAMIGEDATENSVWLALLNEPAREEGFWFSSPLQRSAQECLARVRMAPNSPETETAIDALFQSLRERGRPNTQENLWTLLALAEWQKTQPVPNATQEIAWALNGNGHTLALSPEAPTAAIRLEENAAVHRLEMAESGETPVYFLIRASALAPSIPKQPEARGIQITRKYNKVGNDGKALPATDLKAGDRVMVTLQIQTPVTAGYVAVNDPLPALLEPLDTALRTQQTAQAAEGMQSDPSSHSEFHRDRSLFFFDHLPKGIRTIRYLTRVRYTGEASAAPATVEWMYEPERHGLSAGARLTATP